MPDFLGYIGIAIAVLAFIAPMAYCEMRTKEAQIGVEKACIEARGEWTTGGWRRPYCKLPTPTPNTSGESDG